MLNGAPQRMLRGLFWRAKLELRARRHRRDEPELELLAALFDQPRTAIDVGANRGLYLCYLNRLSPTVYAFEPLPLLAERLRLAYPRVLVEQVALSDQPGSCELRLPGIDYSWATIEPGNRLELARHPVTSVLVSTRTLDSYGLEGVGFIKVDVEGHESAVLRGAKGTLAGSNPVLLVEIEERHRVGAIAETREELGAQGYHGYFLDGNCLRGIEQFDLERDQNVNNVSRGGKLGRYMNNFVFLPDRSHAHYLRRLVEAGLSVRQQ